MLFSTPLDDTRPSLITEHLLLFPITNAQLLNSDFNSWTRTSKRCITALYEHIHIWLITYLHFNLIVINAFKTFYFLLWTAVLYPKLSRNLRNVMFYPLGCGTYDLFFPAISPENQLWDSKTTSLVLERHNFLNKCHIRLFN